MLEIPNWDWDWRVFFQAVQRYVQAVTLELALLRSIPCDIEKR